MSFEEIDGVDEDDPQPAPDGRSGPSISLILFLLFAVAGAIFAIQNGQAVDTEFLWLDGQFKFWVSILASIALGIVLDRLILNWWRRARRRKNG